MEDHNMRAPNCRLLTDSEARGQRGGALVVVLAIIAAVLLIGSAMFILGTSESGVVEYTVDNARALWLAEAGLERATAWFEAYYDEHSAAPDVGDGVTGETLPGGGTYTFVVTDTVHNAGGIPAFAVLSTGTKDGAVRQVRSVIEAESFSRFQWFIESGGGGWSWFVTGEYFEGPVHVNGELQIDGDPYFGGLVRAGGGLTMKQGSNPTFVRGYELNVPLIELPTIAEVEATLKVAAQAPDGLYAPPMGNKTYYEVELGQPWPGYLRYTGYDEHGNEIAAAVDVDISLLNGAAWFDETIRIWGELDGQLTIGASGSGPNASGTSASIEIMDDIIYEGSTPGSGPDPDCDDVLGLIAAGTPRGDIIIRNVPANQDGIEIHAVMMALQKNIEAEDYQTPPPGGPSGVLTIHGSLLANYSIHLAQYSNDGQLLSGYLRDYHYDNRDFVMPPPFFPYTGEYRIILWEEVVPPVVS
jgi:hypothetical protein